MLHTGYSTWGTRPIWSCHSCGVTHQLLDLGDQPYLMMSFMSVTRLGGPPYLIMSFMWCYSTHQLLDLGDPPYLIMSFMWCYTPVTRLGGPPYLIMSFMWCNTPVTRLGGSTRLPITCLCDIIYLSYNIYNYNILVKISSRYISEDIKIYILTFNVSNLSMTLKNLVEVK